MEATSPFLAWGPLSGPRSANTEPLRHVVALPALWEGAEARVCKPQGREPLTVSELRPGIPAGSCSDPLPPALPVFSESPAGKDLHALARFCQQREQVLCLRISDVPGDLAEGAHGWGGVG